MSAFPDHAALDYDERIVRLVPGYQLALDLAVSVLATCLPADSRVLVPGCGTGTEIAAMARGRSMIRFTAHDPSPGMLDAARRKLAHHGWAERVTFHGDSLSELPPIRHDAATLFLVLHFLPDDGTKQALLNEVAERLRAGAPLVVLDPVAGEADERALESWLGSQGHGADGVRAIMTRMRTQWHRVSRARLVDMLRHAGFAMPQTFFRAFDYEGILVRRTSA